MIIKQNTEISASQIPDRIKRIELLSGKSVICKTVVIKISTTVLLSNIVHCRYIKQYNVLIMRAQETHKREFIKE